MRISTVLVWGLLVGMLAFECSSLAVESEPTGENGSGLKNTTDTERKLSRKRRFVAFPLGSSFSVAACMTIGVLGNPNYQYLSLGLNWGIAYNLPNSTWVLEHANGFGKEQTPEPVVKRRYRRDLYQQLELLMENLKEMTRCMVPLGGQVHRLQNVATVCFPVVTCFGILMTFLQSLETIHFIAYPSTSMGFNGRDCILRTLCESSTFFQSQKLGMVPELVRTIFSLPKTRLYKREIQEHPDIQHYNRAYFAGEDEDCEMKYPCPFSLLELAMGKYSDPPEYYDDVQNS